MSQHLTRRAVVATIAPAAVVAVSIPAPSAAPCPDAGTAAATLQPWANLPDPVFAQIDLHRALRHTVNVSLGEDDDPTYARACRYEEAAIQALGDMVPTTIAGAAAQLLYVAKIEEPFADELSPLVRCVLTVANRLQEMSRTGA